MAKTAPRQQTPTPLEGYLEYSVPASLGSSVIDGGPPSPAPSPAPLATPVTGPSFSTLPRWRKYGIFICCCLMQFLLQLDVSGVAVTIPKIASDEKATQVKAFALATCYCLAQTVFQLVFSHVSPALGRKLMFLTGLLFYVVGASVAAGRVNIDILIAARVIQGIGSAGMFTIPAILIVEMTQPRQRAGWVAFSQAWGALGNICGPLAAGAMFHIGWSWNAIFAVETCLAGLLFLALMSLLPWDSRSITERLHELRSCDWLGMGLFFACAVELLVPINIGGATKSTPWDSIAVLALLGFGFVTLILLIYHQRRLAKRPAFPSEIFTRRPTTGHRHPFKLFVSISPSIAFLGNAVCGILLLGVFYSLVIFWEGIREQQTAMVGVKLLSMTLTYPVAFAITGLAIRKWGRIKQAIAVGATMSTLGLFLMTMFMTKRTPEPVLIIICFMAGAGCGVFAPAMVNAVIALTPPRWHSQAIATRTLLYTAGQCIGVSLSMAIFTATFKARFLDPDVNSRLKATGGEMVFESPQELISNIKNLAAMAPEGELIGMVTRSLQYVWCSAGVLAAITGISAIAMQCPDLPPDRTTPPPRPGEEQQRNSIEMVSR
ncbi:hypothetical protein KVR01_006878 [Diaporthe batatas]|uniref:uncharacterized protein n=1 Tax=Diaporthe batatas TaxID=748121 RepID=UPI001D03A217|nr:uncharacterized protein KVR01_006878 [Diaporthe batatas]KAG8163581.1 hypothetical protein KVR01_006878 [Diaporthe batatas]